MTEEWTSQRKQTTYEESKRVMQGQKADIDDMDDKALRTVRLNAAILAIGATGLEISGVGEINYLLSGFSIVFFGSSALFGVIVYNESNILVGPKASFLEKMRTQMSDDEWEEELLEKMGNWITNNQERVELNGALLSVCQLFLILGVVTGVPGILGASFETFSQGDVQAIGIWTFIIYTLIILYLRRSFDISD